MTKMQEYMQKGEDYILKTYNRYPVVFEKGDGVSLYDMDGNELWRYDGSIESQHIALGKYILGAPGLQVAGLDRISRGDEIGRASCRERV